LFIPALLTGGWRKKRRNPLLKNNQKNSGRPGYEEPISPITNGHLICLAGENQLGFFF
jgi:hypothetical protein